MKLRILVVSDYFKLHTGFAAVTRNIIKRIRKLNPNIEWHYLAWFYNPRAEANYPDYIDKDKVYRTNGTKEDMYAENTFPKLISNKKFDIVWTIGDWWMCRAAARYNIFKNYTFIMYSPIDSGPVPLKSKEIFDKADVLVMYSHWGQRVFAETFPTIKTIVIPHGVDINVFYPLSKEEIRKMRSRMGIPEDKFMIGNFNRNQPRKNVPEMLHAFRYFLDAWKSCPRCHAIFFESKVKKSLKINISDIKKCPYCGYSRLNEGEGKEGKALLFLHMVFNSPPEQGWNLTEKKWGGSPGGLIEEYNLSGHVLHTENISVGIGVPDDVMNQLYNAMDLTLNVSAAEGWGLTGLESMAAGTISLVSNYGGHLDFVERPEQRVEISRFRPQPVTNVLWAFPDILDFTKKMDLFYYDDPKILEQKYSLKVSLSGKALRELYAKMDREKVVKYYDWNRIAKMWLNLFENVRLKGRLRAGDKIRLVKF